MREYRYRRSEKNEGGGRGHQKQLLDHVNREHFMIKPDEGRTQGTPREQKPKQEGGSAPRGNEIGKVCAETKPSLQI